MDFRELLIKAVRGLKVSTPETRSLLYNRTRTAMDKQLGGFEAPTIAALRQDLENAILEVEIGASVLEAIPSAQSIGLEKKKGTQES